MRSPRSVVISRCSSPRRRAPRPVRHGSTTALLAFLLAAQAGAQAVDPAGDPGLSRLLTEVERIVPSAGGSVGVGALHLETGRSVFLRGDEPFPMASTYKVPIAVQLLTRVDRGEISLDQMVDVEPEDLHPGSGVLSRLFDDPGVSLSVTNLLELMLLISDNSATDLCLALAGGAEDVNGRLAELGVQGLRVDRPTSLLIGDRLGVQDLPADGRIGRQEFELRRDDVTDEGREAAAKAFDSDLRDTSTPRAMTELLAMALRGEALSPASTALLVDILERVETGQGRLRGMLPPEVTVAHKTGTIGRTTNDVGVLYLPGEGGHVVTVVFVKESDLDVEAREKAIAQIARAVFDFFLFNPA